MAPDHDARVADTCCDDGRLLDIAGQRASLIAVDVDRLSTFC